MTTLRFLLLCYALGGVFVSGGLFFKRSTATSALLSVFILLFSIETIEFLYSTSVLVDLFPAFFGRYYFISGFVYGPIVYFYYRSLNEKWAFSTKDVLHFVPGILVLFSMLDIQLLNNMDRMAFFDEHFLDRIMPINYARGVHSLVYGLVLSALVKRNYASLRDDSRHFTVFFLIVFFLTAIMVSWLTVFANSWRDFIFYYLLVYSIVFVSGMMMYRDPDFLSRITSKYLGSRLSKEEMTQIQAQMQRFVSDEKGYLDGNLTMTSLSDEIGEKPHHISQTLSTLLGGNFNSYVNSCRVEHAKRMLLDDSFHHYKIEAIGLESGFNNKVTFYRAFKEVTHMSPSEFRSLHLKE